MASQLKRLSEQEIQTEIFNALSAACLSIQTAIGQTEGDVAGMFFVGQAEEQFSKLMKDYIDAEYMADGGV